jgi:uncharacterized membrane protein YgdD (TMEM256/DUF423 family)
MWQKWFATGALLAGLAVILGAFGAHGLLDLLRGYDAFLQLQAFETGTRYEMYHAFALMITALVMKLQGKSKLLRFTAWLFVSGILLFSGSLYLLSTRDIIGLHNWKWLGPVTPLGGLCFIAGWTLLAVSILRKKPAAY